MRHRPLHCHDFYINRFCPISQPPLPLPAQWDATEETDLRHWSKFRAFSPLRRDVMRYGGRTAKLDTCGHVFMRWKEQFFVNVGQVRDEAIS